MGRKEYREADLSPDQFLFQATGHEAASLVRQHRAKCDRLLTGLDDDLAIATRVALAITPALILDANVPDLRRGETLASAKRTNPREESALIALNLHFRPPGQ